MPIKPLTINQLRELAKTGSKELAITKKERKGNDNA